MRGKSASKRTIQPDSKYHREDLAKFINYIMRRGKKSVAEKAVYNCFDLISEKTKQDPLEIFDRAIKNVAPTVEVRSRRIGGANYQIPIAVRPDRSFTLAARWIIGAAQSRKGKMSARLAEEIIGAAENEGTAIKKKQDVYKMAEANRAFAHFGR